MIVINIRQALPEASHEAGKEPATHAAGNAGQRRYGRHALDIKAKPTSFVWDWVGMAPAVWVG